ncbi:O-unit flippase-like protein [Acidihalobacter sp.]|uniref:O-unit flippase-like protein n=1 Tax=Acidihalobacter sp. TaxID=1872108 RepID=UPI00307E5B5E
MSHYWGNSYIRRSTLLTANQNPWVYLPAWGAFGFGYVTTFYYGYFNGLLQGRGDITSANKVIVITRGTLIVLGALLVVMGYGLPGLGIASLISALVGRWASMTYYFVDGRPEARQAHKIRSEQENRLLKTLWHNSWRLGVVHLGAFLIQRSSILIASSFLGLAASASYGMTITILMALMSVSTVIGNVQMPHLNALQVSGSRQELRSIYGEILLLAWGVFVAGMIFLVTLGDGLLKAIASNTPLLNGPELIALGLIVLLELNHSVAAAYITTKNEVPFLKAAVYSGLVIAGLSVMLVSEWGIWGLVFAQGAVQLAYNNWKWPMEAMKDLGGSWLDILRCGGRQIAKRFK